jgi:acyl carrier protein
MSHSKEEIFQHTKSILIDLFEVEETQLVSDAKLYQDLDIDSIDTIDLLIELKRFVGKDIDPQQFKNAQTLGDVVDIIANL